MHPEYRNIPASYAGRLDPMAEGLLLVLLGDECKRQEKYRGQDKEYEIEVLLDFHTDTGDLLGLPQYAGTETHPNTKDLQEALYQHVGSKRVPYPVFSSKTVSGKPLFQYSLEATLDTIQIPMHVETVHRIRLLGMRTISSKELQKHISQVLEHAPKTNEPSKVLGADFRQDEIRHAWKEAFASVPERNFSILSLRVTCASGTYMRTLAERIGSTLGTKGCAFSIRRTRIGRFLPFLGIWLQTYRT